MKRSIAAILILLCASLLLAGTALAGSSPTAESFFTDSGYNKTYTDDGGLEHTATVTWVGETWNKVGTVIYSINYEDVYQKDGNMYIDAMSATEIYEDARSSYPDSSEYCVYSVNWYVSGSTEVIYDYRTAAAEETETAAEQSTAEPSSTSAAAQEAAAATPEDEPAQKSASESEETDANPSDSDAAVSSEPTSSEEPSADTSAETSDDPKPQESAAKKSAETSASPASEDETESAAESTGVTSFKWVWPVVVLSGLGTAVAFAFYREGRRRKEKKDDENPKT